MPVYTTQAGLSRRENEGPRKKIARRWTDPGRWGAVVVLLVVGTGALAGCVDDAASGYTCDTYIAGRKDALGNPDPCVWNDPPDAGSDAADLGDCTEECVPIGSEVDGWIKHPVLVWVGPIGQAPECPDSSPAQGDARYGELVMPEICRPCTCDPPTGSCGLPLTIKAHAAICPGTGTTETSFDPPPNWDGLCTAENPIVGGELCTEGYCAQSLDIDKLYVHETGCTPSSATVSQYIPPYFLSEARVCSRSSYDGCPGEGDSCAPIPPPGFRQCLHRIKPGDRECPDAYPHKEIYSDWYKESRMCADCTCDPPTGSMCTGCVATYSDATCSLMRACHPVSSAGPNCVGIQPPGDALLSKQALNITYTPGTCEPGGGETVGAVDLIDPVIFCCQEPLK